MAKDLTIPQRLEWLLKYRGLSQNALARVAKVSPQTVANTLRHGRVPQMKTTNAFAKTLGVPGTVFTTKSMTDDALLTIVKSQGSWKLSGASTTKTTFKPAAKKAVAKKTVAKKTVVKKPVAKKAVAKKTIAKKTMTVRKATTKTVAKKPVAKKTVAARKTTVKKTTARKAVVRKPMVKKAVAKKPVAKKTMAPKATVRKTSTGSSRTTSRAAAARKSTSSRGPVRGGLTASVDYTTIVSKLQKLSNSRSEQVALDACKALLSLR